MGLNLTPGGAVVGVELVSEEQLPLGPRRQLVEELQHLYAAASYPSVRDISRQIERVVKAAVETTGRSKTRGASRLGSASSDTVHKILSGRSFPRWPTLHSLVIALVDMRVAGPPVELETVVGAMNGLWLRASGDRRGGTTPSSESLAQPGTVEHPGAEGTRRGSALRQGASPELRDLSTDPFPASLPLDTVRTDVDAMYRRGQEAARRGDELEAEACLREALRRGHIPAGMELAQMLTDLGDLERADRYLYELHRLGHVPATAEAGRLHLLRGQLDRAKKRLTEAADEGHSEAAFLLGRMLFDVERPSAARVDQAETRFRCAAEQGHAVAMLYLAHILADRNELKRAEAILEKAEQLGDADAMVLLRSLRETGSLGEAFEERRSVIAQRPRNGPLPTDGELVWTEHKYPGSEDLEGLLFGSGPEDPPTPETKGSRRWFRRGRRRAPSDEKQ